MLFNKNLKYETYKGPGKFTVKSILQTLQV